MGSCCKDISIHEGKRLTKDLGYSWIKINEKLQALEISRIHDLRRFLRRLTVLERKLKEAGFCPPHGICTT